MRIFYFLLLLGINLTQSHAFVSNSYELDTKEKQLDFFTITCGDSQKNYNYFECIIDIKVKPNDCLNLSQVNVFNVQGNDFIPLSSKYEPFANSNFNFIWYIDMKRQQEVIIEPIYKENSLAKNCGKNKRFQRFPPSFKLNDFINKKGHP